MTEKKDINHIAIIMDGNSRWAKKRKLSTNIGHQFGSKVIKKISKAAIKINIKYLTLYAFSTENWSRSQSEIDSLMRIMENYLDKDIFDLIKNNIKITIAGDISNLKITVRDKINKITEETKNNSGLNLNIAFNYGSRVEIVRATKIIAKNLLDKNINIDDIDENLISRNLYNPEIPDPDLIIRTGGDMRLSNFLLWQASYSELYFSKKLWPDFDKKDLLDAIESFNSRNRNYGSRKLYN